MKTNSAKFSGIKNMLRRDELKQIRGGSGTGGGGGGFSCPSGTPVYSCSEPGYSSWTTAWCCGGAPRYEGDFTCTLIGYTPALQAQDC